MQTLYLEYLDFLSKLSRFKLGVDITFFELNYGLEAYSAVYHYLGTLDILSKDQETFRQIIVPINDIETIQWIENNAPSWCVRRDRIKNKFTYLRQINYPVNFEEQYGEYLNNHCELRGIKRVSYPEHKSTVK